MWNHLWLCTHSQAMSFWSAGHAILSCTWPVVSMAPWCLCDLGWTEDKMADFIPLPTVGLQGVGSGIGSAVDVCHHLMGGAGSLVRKGSGVPCSWVPDWYLGYCQQLSSKWMKWLPLLQWHLFRTCNAVLLNKSTLTVLRKRKHYGAFILLGLFTQDRTFVAFFSHHTGRME